jgi:AraC-like DNA-binding protein
VQRFDRYIEAVMVNAGYQPDTVRAHLEAGLERVAEPLLDCGTLDRRSLGELIQSPEDDSVTAIAASYRRAVASLAAAVQNPTEARQDRSVRRALIYVREHLPEPLGLARVARVAGFAPGHFARLVKRDQGIGFERYVQKLRLEHATTMLIETGLDVGRIAHRSGFKSRTHFQRAFREATGLTPMAYRRRLNMSTSRRAADRSTARARPRRAARTDRRRSRRPPAL